jgi:pyruvate/2-oxoacid:ferredoxin oxidoreductase beta subunit
MNALQMALAELGLEPHQIVIVSGIGCSGKEPHNVKAYHSQQASKSQIQNWKFLPSAETATG